MKLALIEASRFHTLMVDTSKIGLASTIFYAPIETADHVIVDRSDRPDTREILDGLRGRGLRVEEAELLDDAYAVD